MRAAIVISACWLAGCGGRTELPVWGCGDAVVDDGEQCDLGDDNANRPAILLTHDSDTRAVMPVDRDRDVVSFYDYTSESSHTGFEEVDLAALFLYRDSARWRSGAPDGLSLVLHMGIDEDTTGVTLEHGLVDVSLDGLPEGTTITVGDEPQEFFLAAAGRILGRFEFWRNTDGGAVSGLPFPGNWSIDVVMDLRDGIRRWKYIPDEGAIDLDPTLLANLRTFDTPSGCRPDCTIPRCGDGIVDGGEVCDDGNAASGDGCTSDCRALD